MRNPMSGHGSVSGWVGVRGRQVGCEGDCASTVRDGASLIPSIPCWPRGTPSSTGPCGVGMAGAGTGVAEAGADVVVTEVVPLRRRVSVQWPG